MKNILTFKEQKMIEENPNVLYLLDKLQCEPIISKEKIFKSRINARIQLWMNDIINPLHEHKIKSK